MLRVQKTHWSFGNIKTVVKMDCNFDSIIVENSLFKSARASASDVETTADTFKHSRR